MIRSTIKAITVGLLLISPYAFATPAPCGCVWDNSTKDYPPNSKSQGFFKTSVRYQCGYICLDEQGQAQHIVAEHQASYSGQEKGNEVVCDGLHYPPHENPTGEGGRWTNYFWDGITRVFDARKSTSEDLQIWAQKFCGQSPPLAKRSDGISSKTLSELRLAVGLPVSKSNSQGVPAPVQASPLGSAMASICRLNEKQLDFQEGRNLTTTTTICSQEQSGRLREKLNSARFDSYKLKDAESAELLMADTEDLLLCRHTQSPSPSVLRIFADKFTKALEKNNNSQEALRRFACTLGLRGLHLKDLPTGMKALF